MPEAARDEFRHAVAAFTLDELPLAKQPLEIANRSLERTGLFLVGETHGIAETANAILTLVRRLGVRALALEWSHDEIGEVIQGVFATGRIDLDALWAIPIGGDFFAGDGRFTAGHVAVIELLVGSEELEQVILFDRLDGGGPTQDDREEAMTSRLLAELQAGCPTLAVPGFYHAARQRNAGAESMATLLERTLPGFANGMLDFSTGHCQSRGEHPVGRPDRTVDALFHLGHATPAVVPAK